MHIYFILPLSNSLLHITRTISTQAFKLQITLLVITKPSPLQYSAASESLLRKESLLSRNITKRNALQSTFRGVYYVIFVVCS